MMRFVRVFCLAGVSILACTIDGIAQETAAPSPAVQQEPVSPIPPLTDEDRAAAFPDLGGHSSHDRQIFSYVLFDKLEWQRANGKSTVLWDTMGWIGEDVNRLWFRTEGKTDDQKVHEAEAHLLYGRPFSRWWDFVAGVRQDFRPSPSRTWAAVGIQGLAPYFFEFEATGYVGASWRTQARFEAEYEMLITNRLILQPHGEINLSGKSDPERGIGSGLTSSEVGLRLRYEVRREFAPYVGVVWNRKFGGTADFAREDGEPTRATGFIAGIRVWF